VSQFRRVQALLFDLDGTLIDSEPQTDQAISAVVARHGVPKFRLPLRETRGRTWMHVAELIRALTPIELSAAELSAELLAEWNLATRSVQPIPGAPEALRAAAAEQLKLAVVSSSPRTVIDRFLKLLGADELVNPRARIGGDEVSHGKPDPEGYLRAAQELGIEPDAALVFEDSRAGLLAAQAAGMRSMFVTCCAGDIAENTPLASASLRDYRELPPSFWAQLASEHGDLSLRRST
jgi:mannitol-1-/sugar-/sorbitol-6-phosphatase